MYNIYYTLYIKFKRDSLLFINCPSSLGLKIFKVFVFMISYELEHIYTELAKVLECGYWMNRANANNKRACILNHTHLVVLVAVVRVSKVVPTQVDKNAR